MYSLNNTKPCSKKGEEGRNVILDQQLKAEG